MATAVEEQAWAEERRIRLAELADRVVPVLDQWDRALTTTELRWACERAWGTRNESGHQIRYALENDDRVVSDRRAVGQKTTVRLWQTKASVERERQVDEDRRLFREVPYHHEAVYVESLGKWVVRRASHRLLQHAQFDTQAEATEAAVIRFGIA